MEHHHFSKVEGRVMETTPLSELRGTCTCQSAVGNASEITALLTSAPAFS